MVFSESSSSSSSLSLLLCSHCSATTLSLSPSLPVVQRGARACAAPRMEAAPAATRRGVLTQIAGFAAAAAGVAPAFANDDQFAIKKDYRQDAKQMLENMQTATELARGDPNMEGIVKSTRNEMNEFVAFYRRQPKVAGMPSFSTLYTAINTLSGTGYLLPYDA